MEEGEGQTIILERLDVNRTALVDSATIGKGGKFSISTKLEEAELFILRYSNGKIVNLLISPGENINLTTNAASFDKGLPHMKDQRNLKISGYWLNNLIKHALYSILCKMWLHQWMIRSLRI